MQLSLPLIQSTERSKLRDKATFSDPNFASNKLLPVHRWVPWIAGFSSDFVRNILSENKLPESGTVLDPFAGVGTTLFEAALAGYNVIGFEINPYAALACRIKVNIHQLNSKTIRSEIAKLEEFYHSKISSNDLPKSEPPVGFKTRKTFYSPKVLRKVLIVRDFIEQLNDRRIQEVFKLAFASTMIYYSNYSYEPSLGTRSAAGKNDIEDFPVIEAISEKLKIIVADIDWAANRLTTVSNSRIIKTSFFDCQKYVETASVDLVITSPPYLNNYHYIRNTRPHLYWLGFAQNPKETKKLEHQNFGKYWQTVRDLETVDLKFPNPPVELVEQINNLRTLNPDRGIYGGKGWANYAASYFNDCYQLAKSLKYVLKPGASAFIVVGNSILQGVMIPTDRYLGQIARSVGLELVDISIPRSTRVGNSIIQSDIRVAKAKKSHQLYEAVVELKKRG